MRRILPALLLAAALPLAAACQSKTDTVTPSAPNSAPNGAGGAAGDSAPGDSSRGDSLLTITGAVHHFEVEGGFWAIRGDDGTTYDPTNGLAAEFRQEGLRVRARVRPQDDMMSTHQVGRLVEIVEITKQ
ncbi:MAG TPA: hypothetical protein VFS40_15450 [Gemmatimonadales bacterium]|nr:hypothetical protein [Gemmatimonadales bacterium]